MKVKTGARDLQVRQAFAGRVPGRKKIRQWTEMLFRITRMRKAGRLISGISRKFLSQPAEALLLCRMAWWVAVLSVSARCYSLPRALQIVAGTENRRLSGQHQDEL